MVILEVDSRHILLNNIIYLWTLCLLFPSIGKIQRGAHKRGLKPQIFRENRGEILPGKSGLFGANWRHCRAGRGLFGADRDQFLCTLQPRGKSRNCPERALFGPIGPFRAKPPFAKPPFGFPRFKTWDWYGPTRRLCLVIAGGTGLLTH